MSGEVQRRRNLKIDIKKLQEKMGEGDLSFYVLLNDFQKPRRADGKLEKIKVLQGMVDLEKARGWVRDGWGIIDTEKREYIQNMRF